MPSIHRIELASEPYHREDWDIEVAVFGDDDFDGSVNVQLREGGVGRDTTSVQVPSSFSFNTGIVTLPGSVMDISKSSGEDVTVEVELNDGTFEPEVYDSDTATFTSVAAPESDDSELQVSSFNPSSPAPNTLTGTVEVVNVVTSGGGEVESGTLAVTVDGTDVITENITLDPGERATFEIEAAGVEAGVGKTVCADVR